jgi:hypothetical protein
MIYPTDDDRKLSEAIVRELFDGSGASGTPKSTAPALMFLIPPLEPTGSYLMCAPLIRS